MDESDDRNASRERCNGGGKATVLVQAEAANTMQVVFDVVQRGMERFEDPR